jgi:hypothetical protein
MGERIVTFGDGRRVAFGRASPPPPTADSAGEEAGEGGGEGGGLGAGLIAVLALVLLAIAHGMGLLVPRAPDR